MTYKVITKNLSDDAQLWKYMEVSKFLALLSSKSLWLARPDTFKDKREGSFPDAMKAELEIIYNKLNQDKPNKINDYGLNSAQDYEQHLKNNTYFTSWHENSEESMVMWELYGGTENSVCIKTTSSQLKSSFDINDAMKFSLEVALDSIEYETLDKASSEQNDRKPYFVKRPHFSFENEVRLYIHSRVIHTAENSPFGYKFPVDTDKLIEEIYVHPDAAPWFKSSIEDLVNKYGLRAKVIQGIYGNQF